MLLQLMTLKDIEKEAINIQIFLEVTLSDNPEELTERGNQLSSYLARTSKMLADAKYHQDVARKQYIAENKDKGYSPSVLKDIILAATEYENYLVNLIERQNRTCVHQMDWCRTMVSKLKEEMKYTN